MLMVLSFKVLNRTKILQKTYLPKTCQSDMITIKCPSANSLSSPLPAPEVSSHGTTSVVPIQSQNYLPYRDHALEHTYSFGDNVDFLKIHSKVEVLFLKKIEVLLFLLLLNVIIFIDPLSKKQHVSFCLVGQPGPGHLLIHILACLLTFFSRYPTNGG